MNVIKYAGFAVLGLGILTSCRSTSPGEGAAVLASGSESSFVIDLVDPRGNHSIDAEFTRQTPRIFVTLNIPRADPPIFVVRASGAVHQLDNQYQALDIEMSLFGAANRSDAPLRGRSIEQAEPGGGTLFQGRLDPGIWYVELSEAQGRQGRFSVTALR